MSMVVNQTTKKAPTGTEITTQESGKTAIWKSLSKGRSQLTNVLGSEKLAKKFIAETYVNVDLNPELAECSAESFVRAAFQYAQAGLSTNPLLGQAWMLPRWNKKKGCKEVNFQLGYKGLKALAMRSAEVLDIDARVVYQNDTFSHDFTKVITVENGFVLVTQPLNHNPAEKDKGNMVKVYAEALLKKDNVITRKHIVMTIQEVEAHRDKYSQAKSFGPWIDNFEEMAKKTVLTKLCKELPMSTEQQRAIEIQEDYREPEEIEQMTNSAIEAEERQEHEQTLLIEQRPEAEAGNPLAV